MNASVVGLDRDKNIKDYVLKLKKNYPNRFSFYNIKFSQIKKIKKFEEIDYFIFDLGLSNFQLKNLEKRIFF